MRRDDVSVTPLLDWIEATAALWAAARDGLVHGLFTSACWAVWLGLTIWTLTLGHTLRREDSRC